MIDTHFHLWDLTENYYPWLTDKVQPRIIGEYAAIRRNYLVADFLADAAGSRVTKGVHIQAEHDPADPVRETRWLQQVADAPASQGFPHGIVAFANMSAANAAEVIEAHCEYRNVRGVRQLLMQHRIDPTAADPLSSRLFRHNMRLLQRHGLSFDLQLLPTDMHFGATIAADNSDVRFALTHTGLPMQTTDAFLATWRSGMKALAVCPNVSVKISGFGFMDRQWTAASIRPLILEAIDIFGIDRCMFGSNFPVDGMTRSYLAYWAAFEAATKECSASDRKKLFSSNAELFYRI